MGWPGGRGHRVGIAERVQTDAEEHQGTGLLADTPGPGP